jgi:hypothetical protein
VGATSIDRHWSSGRSAYSWFFAQEKYQKNHTRADESPKESIQDIAAETVAKYTEVLAWFTGILALVSFVQGIALYKSIELGRQEFAATHRPKIFVQSIFMQFPGKSRDNLATISFVCINGGDAMAVLKRYMVHIYIKGPGIVFAPEVEEPFPISVDGFSLETGERGTVFDKNTFEVGNVLSNPAGFRLLAIGRVEYAGVDAITRITGFCREYNVATEKWEKTEYSEYEYAY